MVQAPGVVRPALWWFLLLDGGIVVLTPLALSQRAFDRAERVSGGHIPPRPALRVLLAATAVVHVSEAAVAGSRAGRKGLARRGWMLQTLAVGFPSLLQLRRQPDLDVLES